MGSNPTGGTDFVVGARYNDDVYGAEMRRRVRELREAGTSIRGIAIQLGIAPRTVQQWLADPDRLERRHDPACHRCSGGPPIAAGAYAYLLGQYLGDGHLVTSSRIPTLRISACLDYPAILGLITASVFQVRGRDPGLVRPRESERLAVVQSYWMHWPCQLPQHGPGMKHTRPILLAEWQERIVDEHPWPLIRGLIHSDGCRAINRVRVRGRPYEYPRYFFSNESRDILALMGRTLDAVGVAWRYNRPNSISVARREAVMTMDEHIGPKT